MASRFPISQKTPKDELTEDVFLMFEDEGSIRKSGAVAGSNGPSGRSGGLGTPGGLWLLARTIREAAYSSGVSAGNLPIRVDELSWGIKR